MELVLALTFDMTSAAARYFPPTLTKCVHASLEVMRVCMSVCVSAYKGTPRTHKAKEEGEKGKHDQYFDTCHVGFEQ